MPEVLVDRDDAGVATVTLNREHRKNGINKALVDQAIEVFTALGADHGCRVVVIMGAGTAFCSGMDLSERIAPDEVTLGYSSLWHIDRPGYAQRDHYR